MERLPEELVRRYQVASAYQIRCWSFGAVKALRDPSSRAWGRNRGSLNDEAIFGTRRDYRCACGKFEGEKYERMICDRCGVKVATRDGRRTRFAHIDLACPIAHPLIPTGLTIDAIPVLPATYWESHSGAPLVPAYEEIVTACASSEPRPIVEALRGVFRLLQPIVETAHSWNLRDAPILTRGLALAPRDDLGDDQIIPSLW